ncbi:hypothetical protein J8J40_27290, partial [Mycobacterium tuberculosis]|nr:hypothetical protein [Mycobacterium tuberculosis]
MLAAGVGLASAALADGVVGSSTPTGKAATTAAAARIAARAVVPTEPPPVVPAAQPAYGSADYICTPSGFGRTARCRLRHG